MGVTGYLTWEGEILSETRAGVEADYLPDPLGSTAALLNSSQVKTDTFLWWPFGEQRSHSGASLTRLGYLGTYGYYANNFGNYLYVRARILSTITIQWQSQDPEWPYQRSFTYCKNRPCTLVDPSDMAPFDCERCGYSLATMYWLTEEHDCHHKFMHCFVCCVLAHEFGWECAMDIQNSQKAPPDHQEYLLSRMKGCASGINGRVATSQCESHCAKRWPLSTAKNCDPNEKPLVPHGGYIL